MIGDVIVFRPGVGSILIPAGEPIELAAGDTLRVFVSFDYRVGKAASCRAGAYIGLVSSPVARGAKDVSLFVHPEYDREEATVDIAIGGGGLFGGGPAGGLYSLGAYIEDTDLYQEIPDCITIKEAFGLSSIIGMVVMVMMMGMIMPMMEEGI